MMKPFKNGAKKMQKWQNDLIKDIRFFNEIDDLEFFDAEEILESKKNKLNDHLENSICNQLALQTAINMCENKPKNFLEIGVFRNEQNSFFKTIVENLPDDGIYLGVDLEDKSFLDDPTRRIYTIKSDSSNFYLVNKKLVEIGVQFLDFILIDGWHSINQVLKDWEYTKLLKKGGVVGFHDVTCHLGPFYFTKNLNKDKWQISENLCPNDWGFIYCKKMYG